MRHYTVTLNESTFAFNAAFLYFFIKKLVTPFDKTKAYELGIIDKDGNNLIPRSQFTSNEQRLAYTQFDVVIFNLKKLLAKLPAGKTRLATFAAALWLLKEEKQLTKYKPKYQISSVMSLMEELETSDDIDDFINSIIDEMDEDIANSVGGGGIAMYDPVLKIVTKKKKKLKDFL